MDVIKVDIFKITEWKSGCVFKTKKIKSVWLEFKDRTRDEENAEAKKHGGDILAFTTECRFGVKQIPNT